MNLGPQGTASPLLRTPTEGHRYSDGPGAAFGWAVSIALMLIGFALGCLAFSGRAEAQWVPSSWVQAGVYVPASGGSGITSLNGLAGATQTFSMGAGLAVSSSGTAHSFSLGNGLYLASGVLSLKNSTTAQKLRVYETDDGAGNGSWIELNTHDAYWGVPSIRPQHSGTGADNTLVLSGDSGGPAIKLTGGDYGILAYSGSSWFAWYAGWFGPMDGADNVADNGRSGNRWKDGWYAGVVYAPVVQLTGYTVATLPTPAAGMTTYVTDASVCTRQVAVVASGSTVCPVFYNGTAWVGF